MRKKSLIFLIMILLSLTLTGCTEIIKLEADNGIIDLSEYEFNNDEIVKLRGEWKIAWREFLPADLDDEAVESIETVVTMPQVWKEKELGGQTVTENGYGTLVLDIKVKDEIFDYALESIYISSAFDLYSNGELVASNGVVGKEKDAMVAKWYPVEGQLKQEEGLIRLVVPFSNYHHRRFVIKDIFFGSEEAINKHIRNRIALDWAIIGSTLIIGFYHLVLYALRKHNRETLYFGLFSLIFAIRTLHVGSRFIYDFFPNMRWEIFMKSAYISLYLLPMFLVLFISEVYKDFFARVVVKITVAATAFVIAVTLFTPPSVFDIVLLPYELFFVVVAVYLAYVMLKAVRLGYAGARILLAGFMMLAVTGINDLLYEAGVIGTTSLSPIGFVFLIFAQSFMIADIFSKTFESAEYLAEENGEINALLKEQNEKLEDRVQKRTQDYIDANTELEVANEGLVSMIQLAGKNEERYRSLFENMPIGVFRYSTDSGFQMVNSSLATIMGFENPNTLLRALNVENYNFTTDQHYRMKLEKILLMDHDEHYKSQVTLNKKNNANIIAELTTRVAEQSGDEIIIEGTVSDITSRCKMEMDLVELANTDAITGLYNRHAFVDRMDTMDPDTAYVLAICDIDDFKVINDTYGHDVGDLVLEHFAGLVNTVFCKETFIARIGGEEFAIIIQSAEMDKVMTVIETFRLKVAETPFVCLDGQEIRYAISIGIYNNIEGKCREETYKNADVALYRAKDKGKNRIECFD